MELIVTGGLPEYKNPGDRGADIKAISREIKWVGTEPVLLYKTGIRIYSPTGENLELRARSSIGTKTNLQLANGIGTIDNGYLGELMFVFTLRGLTVQITKPKTSFYNKLFIVEQEDKEQFFTVYEVGDNIGQLIVGNKGQATFKQVNEEEFNNLKTERGQGGFGSTGK